jgi:hypothetical protein
VLAQSWYSLEQSGQKLLEGWAVEAESLAHISDFVQTSGDRRKTEALS